MKKVLQLSLSLIILSGCGPEFEGEAEWTFKTSEVCKALRGGSARIRLHEKVACPMSNAYERVTFSGGRFTNQLDAVKRLVNGDGMLPPRDFLSGGRRSLGELTNDFVRLSIEETRGQAPVLKMEADVAVWLSQTNVLDRALRERQVDELVMYALDSEKGTMKEVGFGDYLHVNPHQFAYGMIGINRYFLLTELFGDESKSALTMAGACAALPAFPGYISDHFYTIVGDGEEPLQIEAKDVVVNGQHHDAFKATVKSGETLRMKLNKMRGRESV